MPVLSLPPLGFHDWIADVEKSRESRRNPLLPVQFCNTNPVPSNKAG